MAYIFFNTTFLNYRRVFVWEFPYTLYGNMHGYLFSFYLCAPGIALEIFDLFLNFNLFNFLKFD